jgi:hypothetical protein
VQQAPDGPLTVTRSAATSTSSATSNGGQVRLVAREQGAFAVFAASEGEREGRDPFAFRFGHAASG